MLTQILTKLNAETSQLLLALQQNCRYNQASPGLISPFLLIGRPEK